MYAECQALWRAFDRAAESGDEAAADKALTAAMEYQHAYPLVDEEETED